MRNTTSVVLATAIAVAMTTSAAFAYRALSVEGDPSLARTLFSFDIDTTPEGVASRSTQRIAPDLPNAWGATSMKVGDADSFGRDVVHLGATGNLIQFSTTCPRPGASPSEICIKIDDPTGVTRFDVPDVARIHLPQAAARSVLCQWLTTHFNISYQNAGTRIEYGELRYNPYITLISPVLEDPALIDPFTGQPMNGRVSFGIDAGYAGGQILPPNTTIQQIDRKASVCTWGLTSRQQLVSGLGLTEAQAERLFASPMTVQLGIGGSVSKLRWGSLGLSMRLTGDGRM